MLNEAGDRCVFSDVEWQAVVHAAGSFEGIPVVETGREVGEVWFVAYGSPPSAMTPQVERTTTNEDIRAYLEMRLWFARDESFKHGSAQRQGLGAEKVREIADLADKLIELMADHALNRFFLEPRDDHDPESGIQRMDDSFGRARPRLRTDLENARDFYRRLGDRYEQNAHALRANDRPAATCREIYWGELLRLWTEALGRPSTSSPTGPLTRFITAASEPMRARLLPSADTIHRFSRTTFDLCKRRQPYDTVCISKLDQPLK